MHTRTQPPRVLSSCHCVFSWCATYSLIRFPIDSEATPPALADFDLLVDLVQLGHKSRGIFVGLAQKEGFDRSVLFHHKPAVLGLHTGSRTL